MIYQRLSSNAPAAEKLLAFHLYGHPAIFASVWAFGDVVEMVDSAILAPGMTASAVAVPTMANSAVESV